MYTNGGQIKANKKDIEAMKCLLHQAKVDMNFGWGGSYGGHDTESKKECADYERLLKQGALGIENIEFILEALCPKWNNK